MNLTIFIYGLIASVAEILGGSLVVLRKQWPARIQEYLIALSAGFVLALVFLELVPESIRALGMGAPAFMLLGYSVIHFFEHTIVGHLHFGEETHHEVMVSLRHRIGELGSELPDAEFEKVYEAFLILADKKKEVYDEDIEALISDKVKHITEVYVLKSLHAESGTGITPTATVEMEIDGRTIKQTGQGDGPVDAVYRTIAAMTGTKSKLEAYLVKGITGGTDAQGEVTVKVEEGDKKVAGHGADTDIIIASAKAYVNALNKLEYWKKGKGKNS